MSAVIHHTDIICALGTHPVQCFDNLLSAQRRVISISIAQIAEEKPQLPFFSLSGPALPTDYQQRLMPTLQQQLQNCLQAVPLSRAEKQRTGLFLASSSLGIDETELSYQQALRRDAESAVPIANVDYNGIATKLQRQFQLGPHCYTILTACTSSANALLFAQRMLKIEKIDHAIVIGFEFYNETTTLGFCGLELISPRGEINPFDRRRDGLVLGEGCALIMLSREEQSNKPQLLGGATRTDTFSPTAANVDGSSIQKVMELALADAHVSRAEVAAIKAHGTSSIMNDEGESAGILKTFPTPPPVFALKPYIGHTLGAAGGLETVLCIEAMRRQTIPGNPGIAADKNELGIALNQTAMAMSGRAMLLNYFAFGGNNSVVVIGAG